MDDPSLRELVACVNDRLPHRLGLWIVCPPQVVDNVDELLITRRSAPGLGVPGSRQPPARLGTNPRPAIPALAPSTCQRSDTGARDPWTPVIRGGAAQKAPGLEDGRPGLVLVLPVTMQRCLGNPMFGQAQRSPRSAAAIRAMPSARSRSTSSGDSASAYTRTTGSVPEGRNRIQRLGPRISL